MNRILNISLLLILQIVYFFAYTKFNRLDYIFITFWIVIVSANTYLLYNLFTKMKNYVKSKNILAEILKFYSYKNLDEVKEFKDVITSNIFCNFQD